MRSPGPTGKAEAAGSKDVLYLKQEGQPAMGAGPRPPSDQAPKPETAALAPKRGVGQPELTPAARAPRTCLVYNLRLEEGDPDLGLPGGSGVPNTTTLSHDAQAAASSIVWALVASLATCAPRGSPGPAAGAALGCGPPGHAIL